MIEATSQGRRACWRGSWREAFAQGEQLGWLYVEGFGEPGKRGDAGLALGALDAPDVVAVDARAEAQLLLGDLLVIAGGSDSTTEAHEQRMGFGHRRDARSRAGCTLQPNRVISSGSSQTERLGAQHRDHRRQAHDRQVEAA